MTAELMVKVAVVTALLLKTIELTVAFEVTVTEAPARISALSVLVGTIPPDHVPVLLQLPPEAVVTRVAAWLVNAPDAISSIVRIENNLFICNVGLSLPARLS
ncbi:MAG: hypothetical protein H7Y43_05075 [Akkermansiaceae bacterium]|nr:hypothetical protein [Verrucomicrobiales bacterium]